ncbi:MAG TPA: hypothetical protein EYP09_08855 [Anaerolineae bacterium]|nr:hypothetical protein [Anaerolineae bacterium]
MVQVLHGEALPLENARTRRGALRRLAEIAADMAPFEELAVMHARAPTLAQELAGMLAHLHPPERIVVSQVGAILGTHVGPGAVGICCVLKR